MIRVRKGHFVPGLVAVWLAIALGMSASAWAAGLRPLPLAQSTTPSPPPGPTPTPTYIPGPVPDSLIVEKRVDHPVLGPGQETTVELRLNGRSPAACRGIPGRPVDMMMVFDISASAGVGPGSNWERTVGLTQALMDHLARPIYRSPTAPPETSRVGLIGSQTGTMGPEPVLLQALTDDYGLLRSRILGLTPGGDTDLAAGLRMAAQELAQAHDDRAQAIVLMLHDNTAVDESTQAAVDEVQAQGVPVYLVVNSLNIPPEKQLTLDIATQLVPEERVYLDPEPEILYQLFIGATEGSSTLAAASVHLIEEFAPPGAVQVVEVNGPGGRIEDGRVVWDLTGVEFDETVELSYRLRLAPGVSGNVSIVGGMLWLDCNGYPHSNVAGALVGATPGPTNTPLVVEVREATLPPLTAPPVTIPVVPTAPAPGGGGITPPRPEGGLFSTLIGLIAGIPDWVWWLLLLLLLLALLAFIVWKLLQRRQPRRGPVIRPPSRPERPVPGVARPPKKPSGVDLLHGWTVERVTDRLGRPLTLRIRPGPEEVHSALRAGRNAVLHIRVDEGEREIGRVRLTIETVEEFNPRTGHTDRRHRARIESIAVAEPDRRRGVGSLMLERIEALAREYGAREIYGLLEPEDARPFFESHGYQVRLNPQGDREVFKPLEAG